MRNITEVAGYLHLVCALRSGIAHEHKWSPHDTREADEPEIRRRVRFVLGHVTDLAHRNDERFKSLEKWALANGCAS
jgi:hypothetical protein